MTFLIGRWLAMPVLAAALAWSNLGNAHAAECEPAHDPSPRTSDKTGIKFYNETPYAYQIYWVDFDGFLDKRALVQPNETSAYNTYIGHTWYVEVYTPDGAVCMGPISANSTETCQMRIIYEDGVGYDAGFCDFQ